MALDVEPEVLMRHARAAAARIPAACAVLAVMALAQCRDVPPPPPPVVRLALAGPADAEMGSGGEPLDAAIAPDESQIVFVATRAGVTQLWRRGLSDATAEPIAGSEGARLPAWKQTGNVIAFFSGDTLKQVELADGSVHDLATVASPAGASWLRDGSLLWAGSPGPLRRMSGGRIADATALAAGDVRHEFPVAVHGSDDFVYVAVRDTGRRVVRLVSGGAERDLINTAGHAALVGDQLLHVRDGVLLAYAWSRESGSLAPRGRTLALDVGVSDGGRALFAASRRLLLHAAGAVRTQQITWLDPDGARAGTIGDAGDYWQVRLSPDDRLAAVTARDPLLRALDLVAVPTAGAGDPRRVTRALAADTDPVWSPDGGRLLFRSLQGGTPDLFVAPADGSGAAAPVAASDADETPTDWIRQDGERILVHERAARGGTMDVVAIDLAKGTRESIAAGGFNETDARFSPDGRWIAFVSDESGRLDVYALSPGGRVRISFGGGTRPRWTRDGRAVLFLRGTQVMRADVAAGNTRFSPARVVFDAPGLRDFDTAHRSDRLVALLPVDASASPTISVILDWNTLVAAP